MFVSTRIVTLFSFCLLLLSHLSPFLYMLPPPLLMTSNVKPILFFALALSFRFTIWTGAPEVYIGFSPVT